MAGLINRGDFWIVDLEPAYGREIHKKRPALIISKNKYNRNTFHTIVVPSTSIVPIEISEEMVPLGKLKGYEKESMLLPLLIRSIDKDRLIKKIGKISKEKLQEVEESVRLVLGLEL